MEGEIGEGRRRRSTKGKRRHGDAGRYWAPGRRPYIAWAVPALAALNLFANHYNRDVTGALQTELEKEMPMSPMDFGVLNAAFFFPNIITPIIMGILQDSFDPVNVFLYVTGFSAVTQIGFGLGCYWRILPLFIGSRALTGVAYEAIDTGSIPITVPLFKDRYALLSGFTNGFLRLGSVMNFVLSPYLHRKLGLSSAIGLASCIGALSFFCVLGMKLLLRLFESRHSAEKEDSEEPLRKESKSSVEIRDDESMASQRSTFVLAELRSRLYNARTLPMSYWIYVSVGLMAYSALVPFYSYGSAIFQRRYGMDTQTADALILVPEGLIALTGPLLGLSIDKWRMDVRTRVMAVSVTGFVPVFLGIAYSEHPATPVVAMILLGVSWSTFNAIFWGVVALFTGSDPKQIGISVGILGCAMNLGPSFLLVFFGFLQARVERHVADLCVLFVLFGCSLMAVIASTILVIHTNSTSGSFSSEVLSVDVHSQLERKGSIESNHTARLGQRSYGSL